MVVGTLSLVQKGQTSGFSGCSHTVDTVDAVRSGRSRIVVYGGGDIVFGAKRSNQWMQYTVHSVQWNSGIWWWGHCSLVQKGQTSGFSGCSHTVDTVCSGCSGIVVYGSWDIVFGAKRSNQWIQSHSGVSTV